MSMEYGNYAPLYYVQGIAGSLFVVSICEPFEGRFGRTWPVIATMGGATIVLLLFQFPFLMASRLAYRVLFHPPHTAPYFSVVGGIAFALIILAAMYPFILLINRYAPTLNGMRKRRSTDRVRGRELAESHKDALST